MEALPLSSDREFPSILEMTVKEQGDDYGSGVKKGCVWVDAYDSPVSEDDSVELQERKEGATSFSASRASESPPGCCYDRRAGYWAEQVA
eukprot:7542308-Karenia_brevis.AAC.1